MKQLTIILAILFIANCGAKASCGKKSTLVIAESLVPFNVVLYSGDESIQKFQIKTYAKAGKYYTDNISPYYYFGKQADSVWTVELDQAKILMCNRFLNKAKSLPKNCPERSSSIKDYTITFGKDTIHIRGDCEWDSLDFFSLQQLLFKSKFEKLEEKKLRLINELNKKIVGKWYFKPLEKEPKRGDLIILTKVDNFNSGCSWEMGARESFKSLCNKVFGFAYSKKYKWQVDGDIYFEIQEGYTEKKGIKTLRNYDATFILEELTDTELKLRFLWR